MLNNSKNIKFFTFSQFHNKKNVGSTRIRVDNLLKYWPEASLYKYGEKPDVLILQKVYVQPDYEWPKTIDCIKILDICDPDWLDDMPIKQSIDAVDAITVPTVPLQEFLQQMTSKPVKLIKDRFDLTEFPKLKTHEGEAKSLVWFGYSHNARTLKSAIKSIIDLGLKLTIISNKNPQVLDWAESVKLKRDQYEFIEYDPATIYYELSKHDVAILPIGFSPKDRFKSENKEIIANLCGVPVAKDRDQLEALLNPEARNKEAKLKQDYAIKNYDCKISIQEYKELIDEIKASRR